MAVRVEESDLGPRRQLAKGGMAFVYDLADFRIGEQPDLAVVYKKYRKTTRPVPLFGLESLVRMREQWHPDQRRALDKSFNWMVRAVTDSGPGASGVILPRLDDSYFIQMVDSYGGVHRIPAEGQFLAADRAHCARVKVPYPNREQRLNLCRSLVKGMALLHRAEVVYGDLSLRNFLFRIKPTLSVIYVDTDSMRTTSGAAATGQQPHTPDWEPPEALMARRRGDDIAFAIQNLQSDRYKLGLAILRIMAMDVPRAAERRDPSLVRSHLPGRMYPLLVQALSPDPGARPPAKSWYEEFR